MIYTLTTVYHGDSAPPNVYQEQSVGIIGSLIPNPDHIVSPTRVALYESSTDEGSSPINITTNTLDVSDELSEEFTLADLQSLISDDLSAMPLDVGVPYGVSRVLSSRIYYAEYPADFETLKLSRITAAQNARNTAQATKDATDADLAEAQESLADMETELTAAIAALDTLRQQAKSARADLAAKDVALVRVKNQLAYDTLTDEERAGLEADRDALQDERAALYSAWTALELYNDDEDTVSSLLDDITSLRANILAQAQEVAVLTDEAAIRAENVTQLGICVASAQSNTDALYYQYALTGGASAYHSLTTSQTTLSQRKMRYRVRVPLAGYHIPEDGLTMTLRWRERTYQHEQRAEGVSAEDTATYVEKTAEVTAMPGDYEASTEWQEVAVPEVHMTVQVVGVERKSTLTVQSYDHQGGTASKRGVWGFLYSGTPRFFRRHVVAGETHIPGGDVIHMFAGQRELNESTGIMQWTSGPSEDLQALLDGDLDWPAAWALQPTRAGGGDSFVNAAKIQPDQIHSATRRGWYRYITPDAIQQDEFEDIVSDEFTTEDLRSAVDDRIGEDWDTPVLGGVPDYPFTSGPIAERWLSDDEARYRRIVGRFKLRGQLPAAWDEEHTEAFTWTEYTLTLATGVVTSTERTVSFTFPPGETSQTDEDWRDLEAAEGQLKWIGNFQGDTDPRYTGAIEVRPPEQPDFAADE